MDWCIVARGLQVARNPSEHANSIRQTVYTLINHISIINATTSSISYTTIPNYSILELAARPMALHEFCNEYGLLEHSPIGSLDNVRVAVDVAHLNATCRSWRDFMSERQYCIFVFPERQATDLEVDVWNDCLHEADGMLKCCIPAAQLVWLGECKRDFAPQVIISDYSAFLWSRLGRIVVEFTPTNLVVVDKTKILTKLGKLLRHNFTGNTHFITVYLLSHGLELTGLKPLFSSVLSAAHYFLEVGATLDSLVSNLLWSNADVTQLIALIQAHLVVHHIPILTDRGRMDNFFTPLERKAILTQSTQAINTLTEMTQYSFSTSPGELLQVLNPCNGDLGFLAKMGVLDAKWLKILNTGLAPEPLDTLKDYFLEIGAQSIAALVWSPSRPVYAHPSGTILPVHKYIKRWNWSHVKSAAPRMGMGHTSEWTRHERDRQGVAVNGREVEKGGMGIDFVLKSAAYRATQHLGGGNHVVASGATDSDAPMNMRNLHRPEDVLPLVLLRVLESRGYLRRGDDLPTTFGEALMECPTEEGVIWCEMVKAGLIDFTSNPIDLFNLAVYILTGQSQAHSHDSTLYELQLRAKYVRESLRGLCETTLAGLFVNECLGKQRGVAEVVNLGLTMLPFSTYRPPVEKFAWNCEGEESSPETLVHSRQSSQDHVKLMCKLFWKSLCRFASVLNQQDAVDAMNLASTHVSSLV
jgi:hypothetical protein